MPHAGRTDAPCGEKLSNLCRKTKEPRWINAALLFLSLVEIRLSCASTQGQPCREGAEDRSSALEWDRDRMTPCASLNH